MEPTERKQVEYQTLASDIVNFGKNNFIEIARKKAIAGGTENEFITVARGFYLPDGTKRYKNSVTIPNLDDVRKFVSEKTISV
jgi:hypothetical protein